MLRNILLLLLLAAMWAPSFLFIKVALTDYPPLTLATSRLGLAAIIMTMIVWLSGKRLPKDPALWKRFLVMSIFANAFPFAMFSIGEQFADSASAAIINGTTPIFTVILAHLFITDEPLNTRRAAGVAIGFAGVLTIFLPEIGQVFRGDVSFWGMLMFTLASLSYGVSTVYARRALRGHAPLVGPAMQFILATLILMPLMLILERPFDSQPGIASTASVFALALFGTALAYILFYRLIETNSATFVSFVTYVLPPAGIVLGVLFLDEQPGWNEYAGCVLIVIGVMAVNGVFARVWRRIRHKDTGRI